MKTAILTIILCMATVLTVFGQKSVNKAYKIRGATRGVTVTFNGKAHFLSLGKHIDAARIEETELKFVAQKNGFRYLVIDIDGWSRPVQNDRQCGAGTEANLIWVKLDAAWKVLDAQSVRYESCWASVETSEDFKKTDNSISGKIDDFSGKKTISFSYNGDEPEKGLQIVETEMKSK